MRLAHRPNADGADAAIVGVPFDTGASFRVGARFGPEAVRSASQLLRPHNASQGTGVLEVMEVVDVGDAPVIPGYTAESFETIATALAAIHQAGAVPVAIGGDHSILLPELRAAAASAGPVGLVQFDAHPDTSDRHFGMRHTHGTPVRRAVEEGLIDPARSVQIGLRGPTHGPNSWDEPRELGLDVITTDALRGMPFADAMDRVRARAADGPAFISFDVDFVDPAFAPGTGTPEVGGFSSWEALHLVRTLRGVQVVGCDVVEVYPAYDPSAITAFLAANIAFELLTLVALARR